MKNEKNLQAKVVKKESRVLSKKRDKMFKDYLTMAHNNVFEIKVMQEACKLRREQELMERLAYQRKLKELKLGKEGRKIL